VRVGADHQKADVSGCDFELVFDKIRHHLSRLQDKVFFRENAELWVNRRYWPSMASSAYGRGLAPRVPLDAGRIVQRSAQPSPRTRALSGRQFLKGPLYKSDQQAASPHQIFFFFKYGSKGKSARPFVGIQSVDNLASSTLGLLSILIPCIHTVYCAESPTAQHCCLICVTASSLVRQWLRLSKLGA
jgi:hypothetical protein